MAAMQVRRPSVPPLTNPFYRDGRAMQALGVDYFSVKAPATRVMSVKAVKCV